MYFECGICLDEVVSCDIAKTMRCGHKVCADCFGKLRTNSCPFCRATIEKVIHEDGTLTRPSGSIWGIPVIWYGGKSYDLTPSGVRSYGERRTTYFNHWSLTNNISAPQVYDSKMLKKLKAFVSKKTPYFLMMIEKELGLIESRVWTAFERNNILLIFTKIEKMLKIAMERVKKIKAGEPCRCGSLDHRRTNHTSCPLNVRLNASPLLLE